MSDYPTQDDNEPTDKLNRIPEPPTNEDDTDELDPRLLAAMDRPEPDEDDVPFKLPKMQDTDKSEQTVNPRRSAPTLPHFREPGTVDPRVTLPGTGGLDPNPDMAQGKSNFQNMPRVRDEIPAPRRVKDPVPRADYQMPTQPNQQYQRQGNQPPRQQSQGSYIPPPQRQQGKGRPNMPPRRRRILGFRPGCFYMLLGLMFTFCGGISLISAGAAMIFIPRVEAEWDRQVEAVDNYQAFESTFFYDRYGNQLYEAFGEGRRDTVSYDRFPQDLIDATVAIEDDTFFSNIGIDVAATALATYQFLTNTTGERTAGGSSITQQVVRNVLFDFEKRTAYSASRKAEEIMLALFLTTRREKEDILALYLNEIYYGNLAYGAQAAAQTFFNKDVQDLTLGEAALLAGLPQAPANLDPLNPNPQVQNNVFQRWRLVLDEMLEEGFITQAELDETLRRGLQFNSPVASLEAPHFTVYAQNDFERLMTELGYTPEDISRGGYRVYTTIDQNVNNIALGAARTQVASLQANNVSNASVVVMHPVTGEILGMVGSIDYNSDTIDGRVNVAIALRQPGSTMKPFTYATAIERGMTPGDVIWDTPTSIGIPGQPQYEPRNYDGRFHGPMYMREALANSYNIPAVQTLRLLGNGAEPLTSMMERLGVTTLLDPSRYGLSLTLGGGEVSLLELANAYGVLANQGSYVEATSIRCVVDSDNQIIYQYENGCPQSARFTPQTIDRRGFGTQVLDPRIAYIITDMMSDNQARTPAMGLRSPLYTPNIETSVKTGTTNDIKDNWTMGYTRNVVIGVWVGNNDGQPMRNSSGLTGAAPIWNSVMTSIYNDQTLLNVFRVDGQILPDKPAPPSGITRQRICNLDTLTDPSASCNSFINEWFLDGVAGVPDGNGGLTYPQPQLDDSQQQSSTLQETSPDIYRASVVPLPPGIQLNFNLSPGDLRPPSPKYCRVRPDQVGLASGAQNLLFIAGPSTSFNDAVRAEEYARQRNLAYLPTIECDNSMLSGGNIGNFGSPIVTAVINAPSNGQSLSWTQPINITGTVQFDSNQADFYHLDVIGGQFGNWTPMGEEGFNSVINGTLGVIQPYGLAPGSYRVRVRLSKNGQMVQQPYEVAFNVTE